VLVAPRLSTAVAVLGAIGIVMPTVLVAIALAVVDRLLAATYRLMRDTRA